MSTVQRSEEEVRWRTLMISDPKRVVELLNLDSSTLMTDSGDTGADHEFVLRAVMSLTNELSRPEQRKHWDRLVDSGLAEALCAIIADKTVLIGGKDATTWSSPATAFVRWSVSIADRPSRTDKVVAACLKRHWSAMMKRLWDDPQSSIMRLDAHQTDRLCVPFILARASRIVPSLFTTAYKLDDFTIPVVARHWANSTSPKNDIFYTTGLLDELCYGPDHTTIRAYVDRHPHPTSEAFVDRFLLGVGSTHNASRAERCNAFIDVLERQLPLLDEVQTQIKQLRLLSELAKIDRAGLRKALLHRPGFWRVTFAALSTARRDNIQLLGLLLGTILSLSFYVISPTIQEPGADSAGRDAIVEAFAEGGFFSALDACVSIRPNSRGLVSITDAAGLELTVSTIWHAMNQSAEQNPLVRAKLGSELPRARTLAALMHRFFVWHNSNEAQSNGLHSRLSANRAGWEEREQEGLLKNGMWQELARLQGQCKPVDRCNRRGCAQPASAKCSSCRVVVYCTSTCQTTDWSEHKLLCKKGWMPIIRSHATAP
ncbi:hypothetical protein PENSPDRAFT_682409 [Peniophora sp. CONT]|nr:hypothetical protein PENSPDRAFT_682409 [Peniophora sp. CONT]